ncbi:callose synthase 10-like [Miscanthus floridulus]|uniref:callose synthase 10-like n=1 Tax=Miscanthus floridulus TaxID=154761 RepID=UPI003459848B
MAGTYQGEVTYIIFLLAAGSEPEPETTPHNLNMQVYGFSWIVLVVMVLLFKLFTATPKKSIALPTFVRFLQGVLAIGIIAGIALLIVLTSFTVADLFASALAFIATGWCVLCLVVAWKRVVKALGLWDSVREIARMYDAGMGTIIFVPIVFFSWFPFVSTFQSRFLFNQAFSRGLEISLILAVANSMISCSCPDISACLLIGDLRWIVYILVN